MKIYKYELKCYDSVKKVTEYLVECKLNELDMFLDDNIVFAFDSEGEINSLDEDDNFLEIVKTNYIKYEEVTLPKEIVTKLYNILIDNRILKYQLRQNYSEIKNIIKSVEHAE